MKIGFIGAGKVGISFGIYLMKNNFNIYGYYSKSLKSAQSGAELTNSYYFANMKDIIEGSDIIFITTNDNQIEVVVNEIYNLKKSYGNKIFVHMSGLLSTKVFDVLNDSNSAFYSIHPLASFADVKESLESLNTAVFTIEGLGLNKVKDREILKILNKIGNKYFKIARDQKIKYHMAACIASNYLDSLIDISLELFNDIGIDNTYGFQTLKPLIEGTLNNIEKFGTKKSITGPISRGDYQVVKNHLNEINSDLLKEIYISLGKKTLELSKVEKLYDNEKINNLEKLFNL